MNPKCAINFVSIALFLRDRIEKVRACDLVRSNAPVTCRKTRLLCNGADHIIRAIWLSIVINIAGCGCINLTSTCREKIACHLLTERGCRTYRRDKRSATKSMNKRTAGINPLREVYTI